MDHTLTGAVLPFEETLTLASRPDAARVLPPRHHAKPLDGVTIAERVEHQTGGTVPTIILDVPRDRIVRLFVSSRAGHPLPFDTVWADPYTGAVRLTYQWGGISDGTVNIVPLLYSLHYGYVAGPWIQRVFGIAALVWMLDCLVGLYLTFPLRRMPRGEAARWVARWRPSWRVRRARGYKLTFDLHRASGLWVWPVSLLFATSAVTLALPQVSEPVVRALGGQGTYRPAALDRRSSVPPLSTRRAVSLGI